MRLTGVWTVLTSENSPIPLHHGVAELVTCKKGNGVWLSVVSNPILLDSGSLPGPNHGEGLLYYHDGFWAEYPSIVLGFDSHEIGRMCCDLDGNLWIYRVPNTIQVSNIGEGLDHWTDQRRTLSLAGVRQYR